MRNDARWTGGLAALAAAAMLALPGPVEAQAPVVKTVPWVATNPLIPHDVLSGRQTRLKGTSSLQGAAITYVWDFGDGSAPAAGTVTNGYVVEAVHTYTGAPGTIFTARLTVANGVDSASSNYYVQIRETVLDVEVNIAIDEGLWYLHKTLTRYNAGIVPAGRWDSGLAGSGWVAVTGANVNAFLVNGHLETGDPSNPYVETVQRAMIHVFSSLGTVAISASQTNPEGTFNPDGNANGYGVSIAQGYGIYQGGPMLDAIVSTGTPDRVTVNGQAASGANPGIVGRTYRDIAQDMVDYFSYCQYDSGSGAGGWRYGCNDFPDNSAAQWAAIGILAAHKGFGINVPALVKLSNLNQWLTYSQNSTTGVFGYTDRSPIWGPYATTPSGMVQLAMDGIGRGHTKWDMAETFMRNNFCNTGGAYYAVRDYYYGLFALVKALLLHDSDGDGVAEPLTDLGAVTPIDWYHAETSHGDACNGVARTLVADQRADGAWYGNNYTSDQYPLETAWAIMMLSRTLFEAGSPVAVAAVTPNPAVVGQTVSFSGSSSFHQDATKQVDSWSWEICKTAGSTVPACPTIETKTGVIVTSVFDALGLYQARLTVTDDGVPEKSASTIVTLNVSIPPLAPTADAGGPYNFCPGATPWFLDGTGSINPDDGQSEPGHPPDFIKAYAWDLDGDGLYDDAIGAQPDVTTFLSGLGAGSYLIQLLVTDNTATSFPSSQYPDLTDTDSAQVFVRAASDPACTCITNLAARPKPGKADLTWAAYPGAASYRVYRSTVSGGPYVFLGQVTGTVFADMGPLVNGTTYYWIVRPAAANLAEVCQSNQASATPRLR